MNRLEVILEHKRMELESARARTPLVELRAQAEDAPHPRGMVESLLRSAHRPALIAEVKATSPSQGAIRPGLDPAGLARAYEDAGADSLSVLTDERFFQGSEANLRAARTAVDLPILRKDFTTDSYDLYAARVMGADAVLLIVAALERSRLEDLFGEAKLLGLDVLVEVHDELEAQLARKLHADWVGVNNRDLRTLEVDLGTTERLLPFLPTTALRVSESGLKTHSDVQRVKAAGAGAVLIGTAFCRADDPAAKVREVMGW